MFLTPDELREWSDLQRPAAICRWLDRRGIHYTVAASGWPKVLRSAIMPGQITNEPRLNLA